MGLSDFITLNVKVRIYCVSVESIDGMRLMTPIDSRSTTPTCAGIRYAALVGGERIG
jgi:hypothetical protein